MPTRNHRRGLPCYGHNTDLQPPPGNTAAVPSLPRAHPAHARKQARDGTALPGGEPLHELSRHGPGPAGGPCNAPKGLEQTSEPTDSAPLNPYAFTMPYLPTASSSVRPFFRDIVILFVRSSVLTP